MAKAPPSFVCSGSIDLDSPQNSIVDLTGQIHQLPCCIKYDGTSSVSHYFKPRHNGIEVDGLKVEEAYFRGRKLHGLTVLLPEKYSGFVLGKKRKRRGDGSSKCWEATAKFKTLTFWNHDTLPSQNDASIRSLHWLTLANAVHEPVSAEDLAQVKKSSPLNQENL